MNFCKTTTTFQQPMYRKTVLDNGISLITERIPSRTVSFGIWISAGSRDEDQNGSGCAHFVEHMLFKGTSSRDAGTISRELDRLGGLANAFTTKEHTCLYGTVIDAQLPQLVALLSDLFLFSLLPEQEIERERLVVLQEIDMAQDTPEDLIHDLFAGVLWNANPLARPVLGQPEAIATMTSARLKHFLRCNYVPGRVLIVAAGNVDHDSLIGLLTAMSSWAPAITSAKSAPPVRIAPTLLAPKILVQPKRLEQTHLLLGTYGLPANSESRYVLALLNTILGGNMSSRLFQEIREKRGLAYSIYSFADGASDSGAVGIYAGIGHDTVSEVKDLIAAVLADICTGGITADELHDAQEFARAGAILAEESMEARMLRLARNELTLGRYVPIEEVEEALIRVKLDELTELANALLGKPLSGVVLGPVRPEDCRPEESLLIGGDD